VKDDFFKFPSTPHLAILGNVQIRGDKVMSESERNDFLQHEIVVEEKVDGSNLGISFDTEGNIRAQNRGSYLRFPGGGQWKKLDAWLSPKTDMLFEKLNDQYILFGEWCYAKHSVVYNRLPDWLLGFDVYDKNAARFLSSIRRDEFFRSIDVCPVPKLSRGRFSIVELSALFSQSRLSDQPAEGLYLRFDRRDWLIQRAKLVRPKFIQSVEVHWSRRGITANRLEMKTGP